MSDLLELAERVEAAEGANNSLDVLVEIALFEPDDEFVSICANAAGTKVICTARDGAKATFWPRDWTMRPEETGAALRARASS